MKKTRLVIEDQVNCRFYDLEAEVRRNIVEAMSFKLPYAHNIPSVQMGRWDGRVAFATVGGGCYINHLDRILPIVLAAGVHIDIEDKRPIFDVKLPQIDENYLSEFTWPKGHRLEFEPIILADHQVRAINAYAENQQSIQSISTSAAKAQPLTAEVLTPKGWSKMGDLSVGGEVIASDGSTSRIVGIYPQGVKRMYRLTFADGRTTEACGEHLWKVHKATWHLSSKHRNSDWRIVNTNELKKLLTKKTNRNRLSVPLFTPDFSQDARELPIDPYLMGALLGDGSFRNNRVCISSADDEVIDRVRSKLPTGLTTKHVAKYDHMVVFADYADERAKHGRNENGCWNPLIKVLREDSLMEKYAHEKSIPENYLLASPNQRLELVRGLMDTDGTVGRNGETTFSTTSPNLAEQMVYLIRSLGGTASVKDKQTYYTHNGEKKAGRVSYTVRIRYPRPADLFHLNRKKERTSETHRFDLRLPITKIEEIDPVAAQCIMIDHPEHLYVTDGFVVTHNTIITAALAKMVGEATGKRTLTIVPSKSLVKQTFNDFKLIDLDVGMYFGDEKNWGNQHVVSTWQSLSVFMKKDRRGKFDGVDETFAEFIKDMVCVVVDEAHSAKAIELRRLLDDQRGCANFPLRWGMTGTVPKAEYEYLPILAGLGPVVGEIRAKELQDKGIMSNCKVHVKQLIDELTFKEYGDAYRYLISDPTRVQWIADYVMELQKTGNVLVLYDRYDTADLLKKFIPDLRVVNGEMKLSKREEVYGQFNDHTKIICAATYGVAAVGVNIPALHHVVLIEAGKSFTRSIQSVGRGLRRTALKVFVDIHDLCSTNKWSAKHLGERKKYYKEAEYPFTIEKIRYR